MKIKIFTCPECKFRKFESLMALNVHIGKCHTVPYRIIFKDNKPYVKMKTRGKARYINKKIKS